MTVAFRGAPAVDRRATRDRRRAPRRLADLHAIAQFAERIAGGGKRIEVIVDGAEGMRLVAMFVCGCSATEPIGAGPSVCVEACAAHAEPCVARDRRQG